MDIKLLLLFVVMLTTIHQGPAAYRDIMCVEPEPGYLNRFYHYVTANEIKKVCPTPADLILRIGHEMFYTLMCVFLTLFMGYAPSLGNGVKQTLLATFAKFKEWRTRPSRCPHCETAPCQAKRRSLWKPSGSRKRDKANFAERAKAMELFNYGLELSVVLTKELPRDDLYWERKFCHQFEEKHMVLFPLCIQRQINYWYPVPR
ncbi:uncharacterized protein LOC132545839 [Ylistrum balloti]|uniref:uncharacterized protein LOC132545839 n=1 Tax=Ylistrum balloti TaxID=509963 RepID=UPI002905A077|nr:uncharacterized protein LOC132545839 [Ylistrum balloti]